MRNKIIKFFQILYQFIDKFHDQIFFNKVNKIPKLNNISLIDIGSSYDIQPRWKKLKKILRYHGFEPNKDLHKELASKANNKNKCEE